MARSVVLNQTPRCDRCQFPHRWCICAGAETVDCPIDVSVLIHYRETYRPTSTGRLLQRVLPRVRTHVFRPDLPLAPSQLVDPARPVWILHPSGDPLPASAPAGVQLLLLDGNWREASRMMHAVRPWGQLVNLPMEGESRYWLRGQQAAGTHSTVEALLYVLAALGATPARDALRLQFELHVYAGLRARGDKTGAEQYLATSPIRDAFGPLLSALQVRRPVVPAGGA